MLKVKQQLLVPGLVDGVSLKPVSAGAEMVVTDKPHMLRRARIQITDLVISLAAASDFGGEKLVDLPARNMLILGVVVDLTAVVAGLTVNTVAAVDLAIGTVTTASTDFSNAGEDSLMGKVDGVGAAATGTIKGASFTDGALANVPLAPSSEIWCNVSSAVATGTGTVTLSGYVDVTYVDLGDHS